MHFGDHHRRVHNAERAMERWRHAQTPGRSRRPIGLAPGVWVLIGLAIAVIVAVFVIGG